MKVFISADMEGTAGITALDELERAHPDYRQFQHYMTAEVAAACEGARAAGVTGTPTFFVNGTMVMEHSLEALSAAVDPLLR